MTGFVLQGHKSKSKADSYHQCSGDIAAQSPSSQQQTPCRHDLIQIQRRDQPPTHQLQVEIDRRLRKS